MGAPLGPADITVISRRAPHDCAPAGGAAWQDRLWAGLKEVADGIMASTTAVWHLQRVVAKKKVRRCACVVRLFVHMTYGLVR